MKPTSWIAATLALCLSAPLTLPPTALAQTGVSDDRVSLPAGPGSLEGVGENVSVDLNMGLMGYGVPIEVPRGFAGITPELRLSYSSGAGNSVVGVGWRLSQPHIERATVRGLPEYTAADRFTVDGGAELVRLPGEGAVYRARREGGFVRYRWLEAGDGREGYWQAEYPDGRVGFFGAQASGALTPEARVSGPDGTFRYMLVEMVDVYGHRMTYDYDQVDGVSLVRRIDYVTPEGEDRARYSVRFGYADRADDTGFDFLSDAKAGFEERLTQRLITVDVHAGEDRLRRYTLEYEPYADSGGFTRLRRVLLQGLEGGVFPAIQQFSYSRSLEGVCEAEAGCEGPFVIDMGEVGVNVGVGRATLVDINGDALPDLVDTTEDGAHRFLLNLAAADGRPRFAEAPTLSQVGQGSGFRLGTPFVQVLDVDGNGFADLLDAFNGRVLENRGAGDWSALVALTGTGDLGDALGADFDPGEGELRTLRFVDLDNDKRIDMLRSTRESTQAWMNRGAEGFEQVQVDALGYDLAVDNVQLTDLNGDGLLDAARLSVGGLRYRLSLGHGRWGDEVEVLGLPIDESELGLATLDDLNGDGLADLVVVVGREVKLALNRNGRVFTDMTTLTSEDVEGALPLRDGTVTVMTADINGNGSTDIVWLDAEGRATALELFPVRPNLLSRVENSLGMVTDITYSTGVQQMAASPAPWAHTLPHPMVVVERVRRSERLSGVSEVTTYSYRDGYYDGVERQFRGFAQVETRVSGDETQEAGREAARYAVGAEDPDRYGLLLSRAQFSADRPLAASTYVYEDCPLAEVPETEPAVRFMCMVAHEDVIMEGAEASAHVTLRSTQRYDGYGNVVDSAELGVVARGGAPCGADCEGDERFTQLEMIAPGQATGGRWLLGAIARAVTHGGGALETETIFAYDGPAFEGLPVGTLDQGALTRVSRRVSAEAMIDTERYRRDGDGNVVERLDPLAVEGGASHRSLYTLDDEGLRVTRVERLLEDAEGAPYRLRREINYDSVFGSVIEATGWMRVVDGEVRSARRSTTYAYDEFDRLVATAQPGDTLDAPTSEVRYELGSPVSRVVARRRSTRGGALDSESVTCLDGLGRVVQARTQTGPGTYQVSGFGQFNAQGQPWRLYQPYLGADGACDLDPPAAGRFIEILRDASGRPLQVTLPDGEIHGEPSITTTEYRPLITLHRDPEDNDPQSPHADTPEIVRVDGLGRLVSVERTLADGTRALSENVYDELGRLVEVVGADGHRKRQRHDLMSRVVRVDDPNKAGPTLIEYDDASNVVRLEDGRGQVVHTRYDGLNRLTARWENEDDEATLETIRWDHDPDCDPAQCTNTEGRPVRTESPGLGAERSMEWAGYDARGRLIHQLRLIEGVPFAFDMTYDNADRLISVRYPNGQTVRQRFDASARVVAIEGFVDAVAYDERGLVSSTRLADGALIEQTYDPLMQLASRSITGREGEALQGLTYSRDRLGNLLRVEDLASGRGPDLGGRFEYDAWSRITLSHMGAEAEGERVTHAYDVVGNVTERTSSRPDAAIQVGAYRSEVHALVAAGDLTLAYDEAGHATRRGAQDLDWDAQGRLRTVAVEGEAVGRYVYGVGGGRLARLEGEQRTLYASPSFELRDGIATLYVKMGDRRLARVEDASMATLALADLSEDGVISAHDGHLALLAGDEAAAGPLLRSAARRLMVEAGPSVTFLHHDHLGSVVMATDGETGEVIGQRAFHLTGAERPGGFGYVDAYGFTGHERDPGTGLLHFKHRVLDPTTGRWLSADPLFAVSGADDLHKAADATNTYSYVGNNLPNLIDPLGLNVTKPGQGGVGQKAEALGRQVGAKVAQGKAALKAKAKGAQETLRRVKKGVCDTCRSTAKGVGKAAQRAKAELSGDLTTLDTTTLEGIAERAEQRARQLTRPATVLKAAKVKYSAHIVKGALEVTIAAGDISAGDVIGGSLGVAAGVFEIVVAVDELRQVSKLDPSNPNDVSKIVEQTPELLFAVQKFYYKRLEQARVELGKRRAASEPPTP